MKRLCVGLALLLAGCAGTEVQGVVRDQSTGEPLEGATVLIGDDSTETDEEGRFELDVDEDDLGRVRIEKPGYEASSQTMPIQGDGETGEQEHEFKLAPTNEAGAPSGDGMQDKKPEGSRSTSSTTEQEQQDDMQGLRKAEDEELRQRLKGAETDLRVEPAK